jgi:two-component system chemotaxis response regulator CheY
MNIDKKMKILVVDDHLTMRRLIKSTLTSIGFENIELADDGATALPMLEEGNFDFLVSDWNMPIMQGIDLLKKIRAHEKLKKLPFLMLTAEAKPEQIVAAAKAGVNDYLVKPFNHVTLEKKINKIFSKL